MGLFDIFNQWRKQELSTDLRPRSKRKSKGKKLNAIDPEKAKIIRKLKHKTKYLELEHEDAKEKLNTAKTEFFAAIMEYCSKNPEAQNPLGPVSQNKNDKDKEQAEFSDDLKMIYREIMRATHPDKHPGDEELEEMCISATQAKQENKLEDLINLSFDLDIDISNISLDLIEEIEQALAEKQKQIEKMRKDNAMLWYYAPEDRRAMFIKQICPTPKKKE